MKHALKPIFMDGLFRDILNSYYNMTKFNDEHEQVTRYRMIAEIAGRYGVSVFYVHGALYIFSEHSTDVISVTDNPDAYMLNACEIMRYTERYMMYYLDYQPEVLKNAVAEYSKSASSGRETESKALLN